MYRPPATQSLNDLDFDLSRSLKVKSNGAVGVTKYDFLFLFLFK